MKVKVISLTIWIILGLIIAPTIYKIIDNNNKEEIKVVEEEFLFEAKNCYNKGLCKEIVYLKDLYENKILEEKLTNPVNKKYYKEESYVNLQTNEIKLIS